MGLRLNRRSFLKNHLCGCFKVAWVYTFSHPSPMSIRTFEGAREMANRSHQYILDPPYINR